jgi:molybdopterin-guanine dinucleotide biosynthesis protein B
LKIIGLAGWSGAGKTTLIAKLIPLVKARGLSVSTVKHAHHDFDIDRPGKDSYIHREAGACEVLVASSNRWALMRERHGAPEPTLLDLLGRLAPVDLVIIEGFRNGAHDKIEVHRAENAKPFLFPNDPCIVALASDAPPPFGPLPRVHLDNVEAIAALALAHALPIEETSRRLAAANAPPPTSTAQ